jgi:hypothetical protein
VVFSGTSVALALDWNGAPGSPYMTLRFSIDDAPAKDVTLPVPSPLVLGSKLAAGNHTLRFFVKNSLQSVNRWIPTCRLLITGLLLDSGAAAFAPRLRPKRLLVYWDSIGEGPASALSRTPIEHLLSEYFARMQACARLALPAATLWTTIRPSRGPIRSCAA